MNKEICKKCQLEYELKALLDAQEDDVFDAKSIETRAKERIKLRNHTFKKMGFNNQPCPIAFKNEKANYFIMRNETPVLVDMRMLVNEPPSNCPYLLEHTVNE